MINTHESLISVMILIKLNNYHRYCRQRNEINENTKKEKKLRVYIKLLSNIRMMIILHHQHECNTYYKVLQQLQQKNSKLKHIADSENTEDQQQ